MGGIYPGISLVDTPALAIDSMTPELDGPIYVVSSSCVLTDILVYLFFGTGELGF